MVSIVDAYDIVECVDNGIAVEGVDIVGVTLVVGVTNGGAENEFVEGVYLVLQFEAHLRVPWVRKFAGGVVVDVGIFVGVTLFVGACTCIVLCVVEGSIASEEEWGGVVSFGDAVSEVDIGVYAYVLWGGDTCVFSSPVASSASRAYLVGVVGACDDGCLALAKE